MKIRRYVARDMRAALKQVRDQQGPDAVIVSSQRIGDQVEVVAAVDFDVESNTEQNVAQGSPLARGSDASQAADSFNSGSFNPYEFAHTAQPDADAFDSRLLENSLPNSAAGEINALRRMLETQLATLAWNDLSRRAPVHTEVLKELTRLGITAELASDLVSQLPARAELQEVQRLALGLWAHRIPVREECWLQQGGTVAVVGPTGVGKTSTLAKLAARWVMQHGPRDLVLISADSVRIGAQDQVQSIGRLLGAPAISVENFGELPSVLAEWERRKFILIDTPGLSPRDARLAADLAALSVSSQRIETTLVLAASSQAGAIEECLQRFRAAQPQSCVLTKLDEATSLGGALSAIARAGLPIAYVSEGQRVAEDIRPARAHNLVARAVQLAHQSGAAPDEDLLSRRFGGIAHALA